MDAVAKVNTIHSILTYSPLFYTCRQDSDIKIESVHQWYQQSVAFHWYTLTKLALFFMKLPR